MHVKLTPHAAELLETMRAQHQEPIERILEHALEVFAREEYIGSRRDAFGETQRLAVSEMLSFVMQNCVHLEPGVSVKDLIHEGHPI